MEIKFDETLTGDFIILRKVQMADASDIFRWRSGKSGRFLRQPPEYSIKSQEKWIEGRGDNEINYIITDKVTGDKKGTISIYDVNEADKVANVGRLLLDESLLTKSNPYGLEALLLTYDYVFNKMGFRKITGDILAANNAMVKLQSFLGMKQEGFFSRHVLINGEYHDIHIMSLFAEDFERKYKNRVKLLLQPF